MPGYDINKFVDLTENEKSELICNICHDILCCPVVTNCCLQLFCDHCINEWLENNNTCPYDRERLTPNLVSRAPRVLTNILGKLRIRCDFCDNGCDEVIALENLSNHLLQCQYNYDNKECEKCFCDKPNSDHDCVKFLHDTNNKLTIELNELKTSYVELLETNITITSKLYQLKSIYKEVVKKLGANKSYASNSWPNVNLVQEIEEWKKEKQNFSKAFAKISNKVQFKPLATNFRFCQFFNVDKKVEVKSVDMSVEMRDDAVNTALQASHKFNFKKEMKEIAAYISEEFDRKYSPEWHCIVGRQFVSSFNHTSKHYIYINVANVSILLFQIDLKGFNNMPNGKPGTLEAKVEEQMPTVINTDMDEAMQVFCMRTSLFAICYACNNDMEIATYIKKEMDKKYTTAWHCIVGNSYCSYVSSSGENYISFHLKNKTIVVFKTPHN